MELLPEQRAPELLQACKENNTALALELISLGVPVTGHVLEKGWTGLHFAALNGNEVRRSRHVRLDLVYAWRRASSPDSAMLPPSLVGWSRSWCWHCSGQGPQTGTST